MGRWWAFLLLAACKYTTPTSNPADDAGADAIADAATDTVAPPDTSLDWWDTAWTRRRLITIDTTSLIGTSTGFPVLVRLDPSSLDYAQVADDGADLRFVSADQTTELPFEIDRFVAGGETVVWVRIPSLAANVPTELWLYHGNPAAVATGSGAMTFADNVSVHHLGGDYVDATGNGHTGSPQAGAAGLIAIAGIVGGARDFDGLDDTVTIANEAAYDFTTTLTVSAWVRRQAFDVTYQAIVTKGDSSWRMQRDDVSNNLGFGWSDQGGPFQNLKGNVNINNNAWHHVAITFDGTTKRTYVDGAMDTDVADADPILTNDVEVRFGSNPEATTGGLREWNGDIDEVRITGIVRDDAWLKAEFLTVTESSFSTVGPEEVLP